VPRVGPIARAYEFPWLSVTVFTVEVASFQPTTTMFRSPAVCAPGKATDTVAVDDCGVAAATCPKLIATAAL